MAQSLKQRLQNGDTLIGTIVTIPASEVADMLSRLGFDFLWIEAEHGPSNLVQAQAAVLAAGERCATVIRVPGQDEVWIKKALDTGCDGIIVPHVNTADEAQRIVDLSLYPPEGIRSLGAARGQTYCMDMPNCIEDTNRQTAVIVQVEHIDAVENIEAIARVTNLTAVLIGPYDLSGSLGIPGQTEDPEVQKAISHVIKVCNAAHMPVGIFAADVTAAQRALAQGVTLVALGVDAVFLWSGAQSALNEIKQKGRGNKK